MRLIKYFLYAIYLSMNSHVFQNKKLQDNRRKLRNNQTEPEILLRSRIRNKRMCNCKFVRQYSVGAYILDFYCASARLGIELDGGQHNEEVNIEYDKKRTEYIENQGIKVIRFWNKDIFNPPEADKG